MTDDVNKNCKITNNSGKNAVILNAFNPPTKDVKKPAQNGYMQELQLLTFTGGSSQVLANGASGTVVLDRTHVNKEGQTRDTLIYNLLISTPDSLYPIMTVGESLDFDTMGYPEITITQAAADNMDKALTFCQNIMTSPSSKMAVSFQSTMTEAFNKGTVLESEQVIADFFNQFDAFKGLDFGSYVAVSTWMRGFAYEWGMNGKGQPGQTYYVYSASDQTGVTSKGTITFTKKPSAPSPSNPTDRNSGLTIELDAAGKATELTFDDGQFIDSPGGAVALSTCFGYAGTFTNKADTTLWPVLCGTLLNKNVLAIPLAPKSDWSKFWKAQTFDRVLQEFMMVMGLWMSIDFLCHKLKSKENKLEEAQANNEGEPPNPEQEQEAQKYGEENGQLQKQENKKSLDESFGKDNAYIPDENQFKQKAEETRKPFSDALKMVASDNIGGGIDSANIQLNELVRIGGVNEQIDDAKSELFEGKKYLKNNELTEANGKLQSVTVECTAIGKQIGVEAESAAGKSLDTSKNVQEKASEVADENIKKAEEIEKGESKGFEFHEK